MIYLITLSAALAFAIGNVLQKSGLHQTRIDNNTLKGMFLSIIKNVPWLMGMGLSVLGTLAYYYAMSQWQLSHVQAILALNPVLTAILGIFLLHENWDKSTLMGIVLVILGVVIVSMTSGSSESTLQSAFWPISILCMGALLLFSAFALFPKLFGSQRSEDTQQKYKRSEWMFSLMSGVGFGLSAVYYKVFSTQFDFSDPLQGVSLLGVLVGGLYVLTYTIGFFSSQAALSYGRALFVVPFSAAIGTVIPILGGIIVLGEGASPLRWLGVLFIAVALFLFVPRGDFSNIHRV